MSKSIKKLNATKLDGKVHKTKRYKRMVQAGTNEQFVALLESLKSSDNATRTQAESQLQSMRENNTRDLY